MLHLLARWFSRFLSPQHNQQASLAGLVGKEKVEALLLDVDLDCDTYQNEMAFRGSVIRRVKEHAPHLSRIEREAAAALAILIWSNQVQSTGNEPVEEQPA